jgi:hypothetical protein
VTGLLEGEVDVDDVLVHLLSRPPRMESQ